MFSHGLSVCPFVHSSVTKTCKHNILKTNEHLVPIYIRIGSLLTKIGQVIHRQEHETINYGGQKVKRRHVRPNTDAEACQKHRFLPHWVEQLFSIIHS